MKKGSDEFPSRSLSFKVRREKVVTEEEKRIESEAGHQKNLMCKEKHVPSIIFP